MNKLDITNLIKEEQFESEPALREAFRKLRVTQETLNDVIDYLKGYANVEAVEQTNQDSNPVEEIQQDQEEKPKRRKRIKQ